MLLQLCDPFVNLSEKPYKVLKVNSCYGAVNAALHDIEEPNTRVHLVQDLEDSRVAQRTEDCKCFTIIRY